VKGSIAPLRLHNGLDEASRDAKRPTGRASRHNFRISRHQIVPLWRSHRVSGLIRFGTALRSPEQRPERIRF
jgi:hypothetical protein